VKTISSRPVSENDILYKIGLFSKSGEDDYSANEEEGVKKENTYLLDESGYLMDW
jgi:hypothetical protein